MTVNGSPEAMLERLRSIDWDDVDRAFECWQSRPLLMGEFLRRSALWAREYGAEDAWPFFDVAAYAAPQTEVESAIAGEAEAVVSAWTAPPSAKRASLGAVRWSAISAEDAAALPDLPDPYEPLLRLLERGGGYSVGEFIDLHCVLYPHGTVQSNSDAPAFRTFSERTLNALDSESRGTKQYFAKVGDGFPRSYPRGLVRRRVLGRDEEPVDEAFTRNLQWEPTEYLRRYALGHNDVEHVEVSRVEAAEFIDGVLRRQGAAD